MQHLSLAERQRLAAEMRQSYATTGDENYYRITAQNYHNEQSWDLQKVLELFLDQYWSHSSRTSIKIFDLAAGGGEATAAVTSWKESRWPLEPSGSALLRTSNVASNLLKPQIQILASDPYTSEVYSQRHGHLYPCLDLGFEDIVKRKLKGVAGLATNDPHEKGEGLLRNGAGMEEKGIDFDIVIVSFALHLVENSSISLPTRNAAKDEKDGPELETRVVSKLEGLVRALSEITEWLVVINVGEGVELDSGWGFDRWDCSSRWQQATPSQLLKRECENDGNEIDTRSRRVRLRAFRKSSK